MQSNISINLPEKNNKKTDHKPRNPNNSRSKRPQPAQKMTSEAFLRHRNQPTIAKIEDPTQLIKKGEQPVRVF